MLKRVATLSVTFLIASAILLVSVLRSAAVHYAFSQSPTATPEPTAASEIEVNYQLPYQGRILPNSPLWPIKALRDKIWVSITFNPLKKAELYLLLSDKRIAASLAMFEKDESELGVSTLTKAEKYLELAGEQYKKAEEKGLETTGFLTNLAMSSLKHRQLIEDMLIIGPEDAKPVVHETANYSKKVYELARDGLGEKGREAPENLFEEN